MVSKEKALNKVESPEMFSEYSDIVTIDDVMAMLHIGRTAVYSLLQNNDILTVKVGRKYIIPKKSVVKFIEDNLNC